MFRFLYKNFDGFLTSVVFISFSTFYFYPSSARHHEYVDMLQGSYYGPGLDTGGTCRLIGPKPPYASNAAIKMDVAMNKEQFFGSLACGMCLKVTNPFSCIFQQLSRKTFHFVEKLWNWHTCRGPLQDHFSIRRLMSNLKRPLAHGQFAIKRFRTMQSFGKWFSDYSNLSSYAMFLRNIA